MHCSSFSHRRFLISGGLILLGLFLCGYAIWSEGIGTTASEQTLWIIDNSLSMAVEDMKDIQSELITSRLESARSLVMSGVETIPGEHAILLYARSAGVLIPFTMDREILEKSIANITPVTDNGGSDVSSVFALVGSLYSVHTTPLHIILLTDGGDTGGSSLPPLPPNTTLSIIAIGTDTGGPIFLGYDALGHRRYKIYQGREISVPYEAKNIDRIASLYHARVMRLEKNHNSHIILENITPKNHSLPIDQIYILIMLGCVSILIGLFLHPYVRTTTH